MYKKLIFNIICVIVLLAPLLIFPYVLVEYQYNLPKTYLLLSCGGVLLVTLLLHIDELHIDKKDVFGLCFCGLALLSTSFAIYKSIAVIGGVYRHEGLLMLIVYFLIYYSVKYFFKYDTKFIKALFVVIGLICSLAVVQYYLPFVEGPLNPILFRTSSGTFGNSNFMGSFVSITTPMLILLYVFTNKKSMLLLSCISFFALLVCIARSSWVAFALCAIIWLIYLIKEKNIEYVKRTLILFICFIAVGTIACTTGKKNVLQRTQSFVAEVQRATESGITSDMGSDRIAIWEMTSLVIAKYPVFGCGIDNLMYAFMKVTPVSLRFYIEKTRCNSRQSS